MPTLIVKVDDNLMVAKVLRALEDLMANPEPMLDSASAIIFDGIRRRYLSETAPDDTPWVPSAAALKREAKNLGGGTLYDTGTLFHSLQLFSIGPNERAIGTDVPYAPYVQFGTVKMVARPFLGINKDDLALARNALIKNITDAIEAIK